MSSSQQKSAAAPVYNDRARTKPDASQMTTAAGKAQDNNAIQAASEKPPKRKKANRSKQGKHLYDEDEAIAALECIVDPAVRTFPQHTFVLGGALPRLTSESKIPFLSDEEMGHRRNWVQYTLQDVPEELKDPQAALWKDSKYLRNIFQGITKMKGSIRFPTMVPFPQCLIQSAKNLHDKMIVINYWLSQGQRQRQLTRHGDNSLLTFYLRLSAPDENVERKVFFATTPKTQPSKKRQRESYDKFRQVMRVNVTEHSTCFDYLLPPICMCSQCNAVREAVLPETEQLDPSRWHLYKAQIHDKQQLQGEQKYHCSRPFRSIPGVRRKIKVTADFIDEYRTLDRSAALIRMEDKRKPCKGRYGEQYTNLILQAAQEANIKAIRQGGIIPDCFPLASAFEGRKGYDAIHIVKELKHDKDEDSRGDTESYHYVVRANNCKGIREKQSSYCEACGQDLSIVIASLVQASNKETKLKGGVITKLDVAKLMTDHELLESSLKNLRAEASKKNSKTEHYLENDGSSSEEEKEEDQADNEEEEGAGNGENRNELVPAQDWEQQRPTNGTRYNLYPRGDHNNYFYM